MPSKCCAQPGNLGRESRTMMTSMVELALALICIAVAGFMVIRLIDGQREGGRHEDSRE